MLHIFSCTTPTHYTPLIYNHFYISSYPPTTSWTTLQSEQQPHNFLTLHRPQIPLYPCTILCQLLPLQCTLGANFLHQSFSFLILIFSMLHIYPYSLPSLYFLLKTSHPSDQPNPPSSLRLFTTFLTNLFSSNTNLLPTSSSSHSSFPPASSS